MVLAAFERLESAATKLALRRASELTTDAKDDDLRDLRGSFTVPSDLVGDLVEKLNAHNARQVRQSIGLVAPEMTPKRLKAIAKRTLNRVRGIVNNVSERLTVTVAKAAREGLRGNALTDLIQRSLRVEREHAKNIAIGQVIQINSELTRDRHRRLGVTEYVWRCVPDRHTRPWHRKLNGKTVRYDSPPEGGGGGPHDYGHPGTADRCRCQPLPVIPARKVTQSTPLKDLKPTQVADRVNELGGVAKAKFPDAGVFTNEDRTRAVLAAFNDVTAEQATAIATGKAPVAASTEYSRAVARGATTLPPIELYVIEPINGPAQLKLTDGRHRSRAASRAGAAAIRADVTYEREVSPGRWQRRTVRNQIVKL